VPPLQRAGGKLLSDMPRKEVIDTFEFSKRWMENTLKNGDKLHFDLTHMDDLPGIVANTGRFANTITAQELRYLMVNWNRFQSIVIFYRNDVPVRPPWIK
jgi:hypothetical protein